MKNVRLDSSYHSRREMQLVCPTHSGGGYYAIDDACMHRGGALSEGEMEGTVVTCPLHGATFDVTTGNVLGPPAPDGVVSYRVQVDGNDIKVELPS